MPATADWSPFPGQRGLPKGTRKAAEPDRPLAGSRRFQSAKLRQGAHFLRQGARVSRCRLIFGSYSQIGPEGFPEKSSGSQNESERGIQRGIFPGLHQDSFRRFRKHRRQSAERRSLGHSNRRARWFRLGPEGFQKRVGVAAFPQAVSVQVFRFAGRGQPAGEGRG